MIFLTKIFNKFRFNGNKEDSISIKQRFSALQYLPKFFKLIWQANPYLTIGNVFLRITKAVIPLLTLYVGKLIIDEIVRLSQIQGEKEFSFLIKLACFEIGLALLSDILSRAIILCDNIMGELFSIKTSISIIDHAAKLDLEQFEDSIFHDKMERAKRQTYSRTLLMTLFLTQLQDTISLIFLSIGLIAFNPWLILILFLAIIPVFLGESYFNSKNYSLLFNRAEDRRSLDYLKYIGSNIETAKELKVFGISDFIKDKFKVVSERFFIENKKLLVKRSVVGSILTAISTLTYYGAYFYIVLDTIHGRISIGSLMFLSGSFNRMRGLLENVFNKFAEVSTEALFLKDFFDFFEIAPKLRSSKPIKKFPKPIKYGFEFENVSYKYPNKESWVIRNMSFTLKKGEKLALVGENGAGKTTIVKLLSGLYDPTEGKVLLDGVDIRDYSPEEYRKEIGIIFQDFVRFQMSASDNIAIGRIDERENESRIKHSATKALADIVISKLPKGYNQILGRHFTNGVDLSGGEWQKVALSRAYMRDAELLILDEPTAAIDAKAEHEVFKRFTELTQSRTAILISHRFSTVRIADRIMVLEKGQIVEIGSHEELILMNGKYSELFYLQAQGYM
jgi:ATP-binding cassette, subfamily B, bacterial